IAKFMALRALGVDNAEMRIVVLNDLNLRIGHAVLVVYVDGKALVLDNQIKSVVPADTIRHYQPVYSVNEDGWRSEEQTSELKSLMRISYPVFCLKKKHK